MAAEDCVVGVVFFVDTLESFELSAVSRSFSSRATRLSRLSMVVGFFAMR